MVALSPLNSQSDRVIYQCVFVFRTEEILLQTSPPHSDHSDGERDSLDDYGDSPRFKEDGSFTEEYGDDANLALNDMQIC